MNKITITKLSTLEDLINKFQEDGWIDCSEYDAFDGDEFDLVMKYLKEHKFHKEKLEKIRILYSDVVVDNEKFFESLGQILGYEQ